MKQRILDVLVERFSQESTWRGLTAVLTAFGVLLDPQRTEAIVATGLFIMGTINIAKNK